jgi:hypothetical protein
VHLCGFIDPSPTKQEVKWESQAEWRETSERERKEAGGVQQIWNKKGSKNNKGEEDPGLKEEVKRQGSAADQEQGGSKTIKGEEDPGLKEKVKRQGECSGSGTRRIQN